MSTFRPYEPEQQLLLPPSLREWLLPDHLVWFISETVEHRLACSGGGSHARPPDHLPVPRTGSFRQFSLRGIGKVTAEFNLICLALNLRRMANMIQWA